MIHTIGIDIGSGAVKAVLFRHGEDGKADWVARSCERIRSRDPMTLARHGYEVVLAKREHRANESWLRRSQAKPPTAVSRPTPREYHGCQASGGVNCTSTNNTAYSSANLSARAPMARWSRS